MGDFWNINRVLSLIIAVIYLIIAGFFGISAVLAMLMWLLIPIAGIWFGDEWGGYEGPSHFRGSGGWMDKTPGGFIKFGGWVLLLIFPILSLFFK